MASSILNSDDGVISGTSGLKSTGGDDGVLVFQSKGTETARINTDKQIVAAAGTVSAPVYSTTGDTNTGIFFPAADTIAFAEGGAEAMRIDSSGNVLVGTTTATNNLRLNQKLAVASVGLSNFAGASFTGYSGSTDSAAPILDFQRSRGTTDGSMTVVASGDILGYVSFRGSDGTAFQNAASIAAAVDGTPGSSDMPGRIVFNTSADGSASPTERMRIDSSGNLLVGTTSVGAKLTVGVAAPATLNTGGDGFRVQDGTRNVSIQRLGDNFNYGGAVGTGGMLYCYDTLNLIADTGNPIVFGTGNPPSERARITSGGGLLLYSNTTANDTIDSCNSQSAGTTYSTFIGRYGATATATGTVSVRIYTNGNIVNTNNSYGPISDIKLKKDVVDAGSQWDDIKAVRIRKFRFKDDADGVLQIGVIAQELEEVSPGLVSNHPDFEELEIPVLDSDGNTVLNEDGTPQVTKERKETGEVTKSVKATVLYMKAVKALQEAMERIETLEAKVSALEANNGA
jgi:hypothetical protein